jgi:hypothetical protein
MVERLYEATRPVRRAAGLLREFRKNLTAEHDAGAHFIEVVHVKRVREPHFLALKDLFDRLHGRVVRQEQRLFGACPRFDSRVQAAIELNYCVRFFLGRLRHAQFSRPREPAGRHPERLELVSADIAE